MPSLILEHLTTCLPDYFGGYSRDDSQDVIDVPVSYGMTYEQLHSVMKDDASVYEHLDWPELSREAFNQAVDECFSGISKHPELYSKLVDRHAEPPVEGEDDASDCSYAYFVIKRNKVLQDVE